MKTAPQYVTGVFVNVSVSIFFFYFADKENRKKCHLRLTLQSRRSSPAVPARLRERNFKLGHDEFVRATFDEGLVGGKNRKGFRTAWDHPRELVLGFVEWNRIFAFGIHDTWIPPAQRENYRSTRDATRCSIKLLVTC